MALWEMKLIEAEADRLLVAASDDPALRDALRALARRLLEGTETQESEPLHELTLGRTPPKPPEAPRVAASAEPETDLAALEARCRLKAEAARLAAEGSPIGEEAELAAWAETLSNGLYWNAAETADSARLDDAAGAYEAVAVALAIARETPAKGLERLLPLLAEVQSALRAALQPLGVDDPDQRAVFAWVKDAAARGRVFLPRYLRADDLADPRRWPERLARLDREAERLASPHQFDELHAAVKRRDDWPAVFAAVERLLAKGVAPNHRALREAVLPLVDHLPDGDLPEPIARVLREVDRYLATRPAPAAPHAESDDVRAVAARLAGKSIVLIGGLKRREAQESLRRAFHLDELAWIATKEHQSIAAFEPVIARPDVAVVLLAIRWSSHAFGDVKHQCDRHGKPLVRLPGGYNPAQVAAQIRMQVGGRIGLD